MDIFPEEYELFWLFESEPEILDKEDNLPLYYKSHTYRLTRNNFSVRCSFLFSVGDFDLAIIHEGKAIIDLHLTRMVALRVSKGDGKEFLEIEFHHETTMKTLYLYLKPHIHISWSMEY